MEDDEELALKKEEQLVKLWWVNSASVTKETLSSSHT